MDTVQNPISLLRLPVVEGRIGLKKTAIYNLIAKGLFPAGITIGSARVWPSNLIDAWIAEQIARSTNDRAAA